jgi:hypothetical protein
MKKISHAPSPASFSDLRPISKAWQTKGTLPSAQNMPSDCMFLGMERVSHSLGASDLYDCLRKSIQTERLIARHPALERQLIISSEDFQRQMGDYPDVVLRSSFTAPPSSSIKRTMYLLEYAKTTADDGREEFDFLCDLATVVRRP